MRHMTIAAVKHLEIDARGQIESGEDGVPGAASPA